MYRAIARIKELRRYSAELPRDVPPFVTVSAKPHCYAKPFDSEAVTSRTLIASGMLCSAGLAVLKAELMGKLWANEPQLCVPRCV
jgi:hypothetical protein